MKICWNFLLKKNVSTAKATHIFSAKNIRILCIESAKTVNEMTLNELVKLTTLWTTGPSMVITPHFLNPLPSSSNFDCIWNYSENTHILPRIRNFKTGKDIYFSKSLNFWLAYDNQYKKTTKKKKMDQNKYLNLKFIKSLMYCQNV